MKTVGMRLRDLRNARDMALRELAGATGINHNTIFKWETEKATPTREHIVLMAEFFGVSPSWLLFGKESDKKESLQLANQIEALTPASQEAVTKIIEQLLAAERVGEEGKTNGNGNQ
ncbi:transcriptional regulator [uncultured Mediterranean phage uvMED]|nr:transcriptional regulator [uncultured Mediterranean phage uvMED]